MAELRNLVAAAKAGDKDAFARLYEEGLQGFISICPILLKKSEDAEDAVSETVLDAWQGLSGLRQEDAFRPWVFKILSAKCKRRMRIYVRRRNETDIEDVVIPVPNDFQDGEALELQAAMNRLSDEERLILSLQIFSGYDSAEISSIAGNEPQHGALQTEPRFRQTEGISDRREFRQKSIERTDGYAAYACFGRRPGTSEKLKRWRIPLSPPLPCLRTDQKPATGPEIHSLFPAHCPLRCGCRLSGCRFDRHQPFPQKSGNRIG